MSNANMFNAEFNSKILRLAPKHEAKDTAPDTFASLLANKYSRLVVWAGASEKTIYGDPSVNWAFRAWHDALHIKLNADFTLQGEILVAREQATLIDSDAMASLIMAEVQGQAEYFAKHGEFPVDQQQFIMEYLKQAA